MSGDTTADVRDLIDRLRAGDDSARKALLERVAHRLHRIASATLRKEFYRLRAHHDTDSVVSETWMRLEKALKTYHPESPEDFYSFMFLKVRQVLLDMARGQTRHDDRFKPTDFRNEGGSGDSTPVEPGDSTHDPAGLVFWTEFHEQVGRLPDDQRLVFDFHYFANFPQAEIARLLDLHPKAVSRLWIAATSSLGRWLRGVENPPA
jgi:RNA polymerase sigma factor (sigma-70 family)